MMHSKMSQMNGGMAPSPLYGILEKEASHLPMSRVGNATSGGANSSQESLPIGKKKRQFATL